jgi:hypothetical protein
MCPPNPQQEIFDNKSSAQVDERGNVVGVVSAKLSARAALASSGALPENVNYAVKRSFLLGFLESVPRSVRQAQGAANCCNQIRGGRERCRASRRAGAGLLNQKVRGMIVRGMGAGFGLIPLTFIPRPRPRRRAALCSLRSFAARLSCPLKSGEQAAVLVLVY